MPTDQVCFVDGCQNVAAFKTKSEPTYCQDHIAEILRTGDLEALEPFTRPDDWLLTRCLTCGTVAHYRFVYVLDKNAWSEPTCRACYWRTWATRQRERLSPYDQSHNEPFPYEKAQAIAEENDFVYLGPLTTPLAAGRPAPYSVPSLREDQRGAAERHHIRLHLLATQGPLDPRPRTPRRPNCRRGWDLTPRCPPSGGGCVTAACDRAGRPALARRTCGSWHPPPKGRPARRPPSPSTTLARAWPTRRSFRAGCGEPDSVGFSHAPPS